MKSSVLNINRQSLSVGHQMGKMMDMADSPEFTAALTNAKLQSENMANQMKVLDNSTSSSTRPFMNFAKK